MIRRAMETDLDAVAAAYEELLAYEAEHGSSSNWIPGVYPTRAVAERSYAAQTLYVMEEQGTICASMILNQFQADYYDTINWKYPAKPEEVYVIHTLCIPPSKAGHGYGKQMVQFAIDHVKEMRGKAIRLDTWAENIPAQQLYRSFGFELAGSVNTLLEDLIPEEQVLLERKI